MKKRYLQRYRLSKRQYAVGCPVVLLDGALLEDRKLKNEWKCDTLWRVCLRCENWTDGTMQMTVSVQ